MLAVVTGVVVGRSGVTLMARILGGLGIPITQVSLSSITYSLTDLGPYLNTPTPLAGPTALTIGSVVFDSMQVNDPRWTKDSAANPGPDNQFGYNFLATLPASLFTSNNRQHVDVVMTPVSGQPFRVPFEWTPAATYA